MSSATLENIVTACEGQSSRRPAHPIGNRPLGVAVVGYGYWGPNLVRNFSTCPLTQVVAVCDQQASRLEKAVAVCPGAAMLTDFRTVLADDGVDAVVVATPPSTHAPLALAALQAGKHVLIEKPMATCEADAEKLLVTADKLGLTLMVDHTFVFSPAVQRIKEIVAAGDLGELYYIDSVRINLGLIQNDINVLWDLAPHDLSIIDYLLGRLPRSLAAIGTCHTGSGIEDVAYLNLDFGKNLHATFHVNWLSPVKVRHFIIGGSNKGLVYNDLNLAEPIKVYDRGIRIDESAEARRGLLINYRSGDVWSPHVPNVEPLQLMVRHFGECILEEKRPLTDGERGLRIVQVLEAAQRSIKAQGGRITL